MILLLLSFVTSSIFAHDEYAVEGVGFLVARMVESEGRHFGGINIGCWVYDIELDE